MRHSSIGTMSFMEPGGRLVHPAGEHGGIGGEIAVEAGAQFLRDLHGLIIGDEIAFQSGPSQFL
jgi:hypothetical protein